MVTLIRTLVLYITDGSYPVISADWRGMQSAVNRERHCPVDVVNGNEVHVLDLDRLPYSRDSRDPITALSMAFDRWCKRHLRGRAPEIIVAGQTPLADRCINTIRRLAVPPYIVVRFSMFYGQGGAPYPGDTLDPAGLYTYDCPKDFNVIWEFLSKPEVIAAVASKNQQALTAAVSSFNATRPVPILTFTALNEPARLVSE